MRKSLPCTLLLSGLAALAMTAGAGAAGEGLGRPIRGYAELTPPEGSTDEDALCRVRVRYPRLDGEKDDRSWLRMQAMNLERNSGYTLLATNPVSGALEEFGTLTTNGAGRAYLRIDTKKGGKLPFGATLADLAGATIEVRDASDVVVLAGTLPKAE